MILTITFFIILGVILVILTGTDRGILEVIAGFIILSPYFLFSLVLYKVIYRHHYNHNWLDSRKLLNFSHVEMPKLTEEFELWLKENKIKYKFSNTFDIFAVKSKHDAIAIKLKWS